MANVGGPFVAPSSRTWLGVAREIYAGSALLPTNTIPQSVREYSLEDTPRFLPDEAIRGSLAMRYADILGPEDATFSFGGPLFLDSHGFFLDNAFGDLSTTGSNPANGTTVSGSVSTLAIGGTQCTVASATGYAIGSAVSIDTGNITETVVLTAVSGSLLTFGNNPLRFPHAAAATVNTVNGPYTHTFALLNSNLGYGGVAGGQPPTHTLTDYTLLNYSGTPNTNTSSARQYAYACVQGLDITGNAESLLQIRVSGNSWLSTPAPSSPVNTVSTVTPPAAVLSQVFIGGTTASNLVTTISDWAFNLKRTLQVYFNTQGTAQPFVIGRGPLDATGTLHYSTPQDESPLTQMLNNTQPQMRIVQDNGLTGTSHLRLQIDVQQAAFTKAKIDRSAVMVAYADSWEAVANSQNTGGSGGLGPCTVTLINNTPTY
jgi:hypothetical protein